MPFSVFSMSDAGHLGFWALRVPKNVLPEIVLVHTQIKSNQSLSYFGHPIPTGL